VVLSFRTSVGAPAHPSFWDEQPRWQRGVARGQGLCHPSIVAAELNNKKWGHLARIVAIPHLSRAASPSTLRLVTTTLTQGLAGCMTSINYFDSEICYPLGVCKRCRCTCNVTAQAPHRARCTPVPPMFHRPVGLAFRSANVAGRSVGFLPNRAEGSARYQLIRRGDCLAQSVEPGVIREQMRALQLGAVRGSIQSTARDTLSASCLPVSDSRTNTRLHFARSGLLNTLYQHRSPETIDGTAGRASSTIPVNLRQSPWPAPLSDRLMLAPRDRAALASSFHASGTLCSTDERIALLPVDHTIRCCELCRHGT